MKSNRKGTLIIIGGHEDKAGEREILTEVTRKDAGRNGHLLIITAATQHPKEVGEEYLEVFRQLGVKHLDVLDIRARQDAYNPAAVEKMRTASTVFFTGGDQLRITSQMADSPVYRCLMELFEKGATIAGTSAGAAAMAETMIVSGPSDSSAEISAVGLAPGLGLTPHIVIDSHFAERGRFGRLLGVVAQNPANVGVGIDEDTAIVLHGEQFRVIGSGAVYVMDGTGISYSSLSEERPQGILSIFDAKLHVLSRDDAYDLAHKRPIVPEA